MEVIWKTVTVILNQRLGMAITFPEVLHGFRSGRGAGTASLKAKLIQQLTAMKVEVLYDIFLDLYKAYNDLDSDTCLGILTAYGVGERAIYPIQRYWDRLTMVDQGGG